MGFPYGSSLPHRGQNLCGDFGDCHWLAEDADEPLNANARSEDRGKSDGNLMEIHRKTMGKTMGKWENHRKTMGK